MTQRVDHRLPWRNGLLGLCLLTSACLDFDKQLGTCVDAGKCQAPAVSVDGGHDAGGGGGGGAGGGSGGGTGGGPTGASLVGAPAIDFGQAALGDTVPMSYSFLNDGGTSTARLALFVDGGVFTVTGAGCNNVALSPTASCDVQVSASPVVVGMSSGSLFIDGGAGVGLVVGLLVEGILPVSVSPTTQSFGNVLVGNDAPRVFTVRNHSVTNKPLAISVSGDAEFSLGPTTCTGTLLPGNTCRVEVVFSPVSVNLVRNGVLNVTPTATATLSGVGVPLGELRFVQSDLDFPIVDAGTMLVQTVMLSNVGATPSGPISFSIPSGTRSFGFDAGLCVNGLGASSMCPVSVSYSPESPGQELASLEAASDAGTAYLQLSGIGRVEWTLTVISDGGVITLSAPTGATCPSSCTHRYEHATAPANVFLQETAGAGMIFSSWSGCQPVTGGCTVVMDQDQVVTAEFERLQPRLQINDTGGSAVPSPGGTMCGPGCYDFAPSQSVTVTAAPWPGNAFAGFSDDCNGAVCQLVMNGPKTVTANFSGPHNYVFVSNATFQGSGLGNQAAVDAVCVNEAADAGLPVQGYRAWLSRTGAPIPASSSFVGARGWIRPDGRPFADELPLSSGTSNVLYPVGLTARGMAVAPFVWTGTGENGTTQDTCFDWSVAGGPTGLAGSALGGSFKWTSDAVVDCATAGSVLCFGTQNSSALSVPLPPSGARLIFVTQSSYAIGNGDSNCQDEAMTAGLPGTFKALRATVAAPASDLLPNTLEPLYRPDGVLVALRSVDFRNGAPPLAPINVTASGNHVGGEVWTGSNVLTEAAGGKNCDDWTNGLGETIAGQVGLASEAWWNQLPLLTCMGNARLYCVR